MRTNFFNILLIFTLISLIFLGCARKITPSGGPKDNDPPVPLQSRPLNYSTNFNGKNIIVKFDEYIKLTNVGQELLVSPPMEEKPEVILRGKQMVIKLNSKLKDSTTYNLNFYESVADNNEGNMLPNFQFEFSTGAQFDSLYAFGRVQDAFNFKTEKGIYILLYSDFNDSLPRTTLPECIAKTDKEGYFMLSNLKQKPYYAFALKDLNYNYLFDLPNEAFAFSTESFIPDFKEYTKSDTLKILDTLLSTSSDTVYRDSIISESMMVTTIDDLHLFAFVEDYEKQYFRSYYRPEKEQVVFAFNCEIDSLAKVVPLDAYNVNEPWYKQEKQTSGDSLVYWLTDSLLYKRDSLKFAVSYTMPDSTGIPHVRIDTFLTVYKKPQPKEDKTKQKSNKSKFSLFDKPKEEVKEDTIIISPLSFTANIKQAFDLNIMPELLARFPIANICLDSIIFEQLIDTIWQKVKFTIGPDSVEFRKIKMKFELKPETKYKLIIPKGTFTDYYGNKSDSLGFSFTSKAMADYGLVKLNLQSVRQPAVVQLMDDKEKIYCEKSVEGDTTLVFDFLTAGKYRFKLFYDSNRNGKWDTGNYRQLLQAEEVFYFEQDIDAKANWDMDYDWDLYPVIIEEESVLDSEDVNTKTIEGVSPLEKK